MFETLAQVRYPNPHLEWVLDAVEDLGFITGGVARVAIMGSTAPEAEDYDVFLRDAGNLDQLATRIQGLGYELEDRPGHSLLYTRPSHKPIEIILPVDLPHMLTVGAPDVVLGRFAFFAEQFAVWLRGHSIVGVYTTEGQKDVETRTLRINHIGCPIKVAWRAVKYGRKGFHIHPMELHRLLEHWRCLSDQQRADLEGEIHEEGSF